jgi:flagellar motility protein MotE (MotC chaperone)
MSSLRILPLLILVSGLVLSLKVSDVVSIWRDGGNMKEVAAVSVVQAARAQDSPANPAGVAGEPGLDAPVDDALTPAMDQEAASGSDAGDQPPTFGGDPTLFTQEEIDLLQNLSARRSELDRREQRLDERESLITAAEARIDSKIAEMKQLQASIAQLVEKKDEKDEDRIKKLITVYEKMKPKDAARIWNDLDMNILLQVAQGMREANAAAVMAQMTPDRARALTTELAYKRDLSTLPLTNQ